MKTSVKVEILGREYSIRSDEGEDRVKKIAAYINQKLKAVSEGTKTVSTLDVAILVAMDVANEYFEALEGQNQLARKIELKSDRLIERIKAQMIGKN
jgi:cell division protein ZapA